ncbi:transmembrane protein 256 homolog [Strongylocentrotus purpuratus]|uniref:Transmembrane protein 256 homolog n=1 Tax=Strongylocentrotus purpuratus TaxID=7668 RepID=A0A7M7SX30_STRPU|nr:transmembrane protein 256 homolog [Strongylocentrotus purpuratus]XP_030837685.1 transmembrane protein 256 homolog [Strongylocentrotus purpuratus]|eukprot:XP_011662190.1 PREDICTED: transmembrane protein 256 homolog [Strongylocentrotus purpuratus]
MPAIVKPGELFVQIAGISGALAVALGAYGAHGMKNQSPEAKHTFDTASRYHFVHTLALLGIPLTNNPNLSGSLLTLGMVLFSGTCYFSALTGSTALNRLAPIGGMTLIAGWASMALGNLR